MTGKSAPRNFKVLAGGIAILLAVVAVGSTVVMMRVFDVAEEQRTGAATIEVKLQAGNFHIGEKLPPFTLLSPEGDKVSLSDFQDGEHFLVVSTHHPDCPCAANCGRLISEMEQQGYDDVRVIGVMSDGTKDQRVLAALQEQKDEGTVTFPVYFDPDKSAQKLLGAKRTPEMWVLDKQGVIRFYGAPENTLFPGSKGHRYLLREAIDAMRKGEAPEIQRYDPIGCPIGG